MTDDAIRSFRREHRPGVSPWSWWCAQLLGLGLVGAFAWCAYQGRWSGTELVVGAVVTAPANFVLWGLSMVYWVPAMRDESWLEARLSLSGETLMVLGDAPIVVDLARPHALEVGGDAVGRFSLTVYVDGRRERVVPFWARGVADSVLLGAHRDPAPDPMSPSDVPSTEWDFGDALLERLEAAASRNRYAEVRRQLRRHAPTAADSPFVVEVAAGDEAPVYRSGRPAPDGSGYASWLERNGLRLGPGLVVGAEHVVVDTEGGALAFPIGATEVDDAGAGTLHGRRASGERVEVPSPGDPMTTAALAAHLRER